MKPSDTHKALVAQLARLEGMRRANAHAQAAVAREAHARAGLANRVRGDMLPVLEGGTCELGAQDLAHSLTDEEQRMRRVGVLLDRSAGSPDLLLDNEEG